MENKQISGQANNWLGDKKLLTGFILVILSIALGIYGKVLLIIKFYQPFYVITGLSIYAVSWVILFVGAFLVGWETVELIRNRIEREVRITAQKTYNYTKRLPRKGYDYTKGLHKKGIDKISRTSKAIVEKIRH